MRVAIDAGHGYFTPGKRIPSANYVRLEYRDRREWYLNQRIANEVESIIKQRSLPIEIVRLDDITGAKDISLSARAKKTEGCRVMISIHHNAGLSGRKGGGTVVYHDRTSRNIAQKLYDNVVRMTGLVGNRSQKVIKKAFTIIYRSKAPISLLIENGFMDGPDDIPIIVTQEHAHKTAIGIVDFLEEIM